MAARLLLWASTVVFPLPLVLTLNAQMDDALSLRIPITFGLIAYSWWLLGIILSTRPSWLDRAVGLPSIYAVHGVLAVLAIVPAYLHRQNTFAPDRLALLLGDWAFWSIIVVVCHAVLFLSGWLTDRSRIAHRAKAALEVVFRHQLSVWIHRATIAIVLLIWLHVHVIDRVNQHLAFMTLFDVYTVTVLGIYAWKKWVAPQRDLAGVVGTSEPLNASTRRLEVALDEPATNARPGDFYFARFEGRGVSREPHPFSATDASTDRLAFTIRASGDFTRTLDRVTAGTPVRLEGPFGRFAPAIERLPACTPLVFLGMGAGIAPLLSLADAHHGHRPINVLWSVRNSDDAYYADVLAAYESSDGAPFRSTIQVGRFRPETLRNLLSSEELKAGRFFVVGPNPAVLATQRLLRRLGVPEAHVEQERLTM
ncbi:FAD-binding oxidoreductase [Curtobacterium sp. YR515]|uniref:FAD-binding oxidoreductase n=1 Tax=Curtobacterium sp. YR515 TaxID=1855316 RepID=UPI0008E5D1AB|nr:FAD-binding oxidoreductase [Curtobacterium sp. YR515]SFF73822.1 Predicted ferric reductase [Curtobacterium sp. YR515]